MKCLLLVAVSFLLGACTASQNGGIDFYRQKGGPDYLLDYYRCREAANAISDAKRSYDTYVNCMEKSGWIER